MAKNYSSNYKDVRNFLVKLPGVVDRRISYAMEQALLEVGNEILQLASQYVPKDELNLLESGYRSDVTWSGKRAFITIGFGGTEDSDHAYLVEFDLGSGAGRYGYKTPDPGAGPLYLTRAVDETATTENIRTKFLNNMRRAG